MSDPLAEALHALVEGEPEVLQATLRALVREMPGTFLLADPGGKILAASLGRKDVVGMTADEIENLGWPALVHPEDLPGVRAQVEAQRGAPTVQYSLRWLLPSGKVVSLVMDAATWVRTSLSEDVTLVSVVVDGYCRRIGGPCPLGGVDG